MKKRTRIASLVAAVAMTVSALPMAALPALAIQTTTEGDHGTLTNAVYQIRKAPDNLHAPASDSNPAQNLVEISRDDLAKGDYTFKAAAYIKADGQMTDDDFVSTISMKWQASNYKYMRFAEDDYTSVIPMETYELSDGTKFNATLRPFSLAKITHSPKKGDGYFTPLWRVVTNETAVEPCTGTPVYSAGPNKIKFTCTYYTEGQYKSPDSKVIVPVESSKTTKEFTLDLTVDEETNTATYDFQVPQQGTQPGAYPMFAYHGVIHNYDSSTPEGQVINGDNDMIRMQYGEDNGTKWLDGKSDSYPIMTFDVTMSKDTPDGYYYVNFDTESGSPYIEDNQSIILKMNRMVRAYKENGKSLVETIYPTGLEDKSNFLTIKVGDAKETTATTTATTTTSAAETTTTVSETTVPVTTAATTAATTAPATSSEAPTTTTTNGLVVGNEPTMAVNNGQKIFATPGQEYAEIPLNLYNVPDTEGITVAFKTDAEGTPTLALLKDAYQLYEAADAFVNLGKWEANPKGLSWGVPSSGKQMVKSGTFADGDVFLSLYYNIPDEATVEKIAEANNLELKHNAEYGAYYEFPLVFEREKLNNKDGKLLDWVGTNNTKVNATYVDSNLIVKVTDTQTTTTTGATTTSTTTTTTTDSGIKDPTAPRMEVRGDKKNDHKIVVTPGQEYAEIPLSLYNVPDTEGITVAFKTDGVGTPTLALLKDSYQLYEAADAFVNLGKWEANPKGLSWGVPSSGKQMVKGSDFADGDVFLSLYYNIPDEATVEKIAEANNLELKQDDEYGYYYEFPLVFEREKLNNKDGKLLDWVGTNNTKINAEYVDGSLIVKMSNVTTTTTTTGTTTSTTTTTTTFDPTVPRMEVYGEENGEKKNHKVVVTPGQEYAEIPLNLYNVPDTEGITVAFKTDGEGTPTLALLKDSYQLYEAADAFVNLGKWEANPKGLSWGVPSSGKQMVKSGDFADGDVFLSLYYNIPDEATVKDIAKANGMELKHDDEYGAYYEFPLIFEREKLNNKDGKLLDWVGTNNTKINAIYVDGSIIVKMPDETTTTTTTTGTTTTTVTTTTADSTTSGSATTTSGAATTTSGSAETTSATTGTDNTGETTTTTKGQLVPLYGDVNVNGQVTIVDVVLLNKAIAGKVTLSEQAFLNADCGNVDQVLDEHDLNALMQYLVGIVQQLPGEAK